MKDLVLFQNLAKRFAGRMVLEGLDLRLAPGEVMGIVGPSGVGKSTLLRLAAGLEKPSQGRVTVRAKRMSYVFQEPRLLPWFSALENVALAARARGERRQAARQKAGELLDSLRLGDSLQALPHELSGGMRQRVSLARAMVVRPDLLLLDEPFTGLDPELRDEVRGWLEARVRAGGCAVMHVTHDTDELFTATRSLLQLQGAGDYHCRPLAGQGQTPAVLAFLRD